MSESSYLEIDRGSTTGLSCEALSMRHQRAFTLLAIVSTAILICPWVSARKPPPDDATEAAKLSQEAVQLFQAGRYSEAEPLFQRALKVSEKAPRPDQAQIALILNNLAVLYGEKKEYAKAEPLYRRALGIREKTLGPEHADTVFTTECLGLLYEKTHDYTKAQPLFLRTLMVNEKNLGPEHPKTATCLSNLSRVYEEIGNFAKAAPLYERFLNIDENKLSVESPREMVSRLSHLAALYARMGDYAKVESLYQRAIDVYQKAYSSDSAETADAVEALGQLYNYIGDYAKAEPFYQRALEIKEKALGPEHPGTLAALNNLTVLYEEIGDYAKAESLYERALKVKEETLGPTNPRTATGLDNLARLYFKTGNYAKAEPLFQRALKIQEKVLGAEHPEVGRTLNNLALLYSRAGDYAKARPLYERSLKINEKERGSEDPDTATVLSNLANVYRVLGEFAKAEPLFLRALKINEKMLGSEHQNTATALNNLAWLYYDMGQQKEAVRLTIQAERIKEKTLSNILSFTSEQQRLAFQKTEQPYNFFGTLGSAPELAEVVLRRKGIVLDSLLEDRLIAEASQDPKQHEIVNELRSAKERLLQWQLETPKGASKDELLKHDRENKELSSKVEELEASLARQVAGLGRARRELSVTVPQVQAALGKDETLIELLRYDHYLGKNKSEPRYGAVAMASGGEPKWVPLGGAAEIEKKIQLYQKSARGKTDEATLSNVLRALHTQIWLPIEKALPAGTKTVVISPDAELSFVSFATLVGPDDKFLAEKYSIRYVASGRDLLQYTKASGNPQTAVYANPDFDSKTASPDSNRGSAVALRSLEMRDLQSILFLPLPGTEAEAAALETRAGKSAKVFLGPNATEAELRQINAPHVLHLATHGFFLPEVELGEELKPFRGAEEIPKGKLVNPMHRSGLALAGAQTTLQAWARGEVPPTENDGIVTAEEAGGLKLDGTWLVVLSACETGSGEARAGEGVMGLRRGFIQAGAQNLLMTLWPISDETTVQIMFDFYDAAEKTKNAPQALADVQRDWLVKLRKERDLLDAFRLAGPFIMSSQGRQ
jgi:tetratricopeptide (TPR) repeat protein